MHPCIHWREISTPTIWRDANAAVAGRKKRPCISRAVIPAITWKLIHNQTHILISRVLFRWPYGSRRAIRRTLASPDYQRRQFLAIAAIRLVPLYFRRIGLARTAGFPQGGRHHARGRPSLASGCGACSNAETNSTRFACIWTAAWKVRISARTIPIIGQAIPCRFALATTPKCPGGIFPDQLMKYPFSSAH